MGVPAGQEAHLAWAEGVAAHAHFYTAKELGEQDKNAPEDALAQIESHAVAHLEKLAAGDIKLTEQEKAEFATFMGDHHDPHAVLPRGHEQHRRRRAAVPDEEDA